MSSDWTSHRLEDCMEAIIDYRGKTPVKTTSGIPLITAKVVKGGRIETPNEFIAIEDYDSWMRRGLPEAGDVLITTEAPLGEVAQLSGERVALAQRLITLRGKANILNNTYLKFLLLSEGVQEQLRARATGTTVLGIKQSELRKVVLTLPPFKDQVAIARILGSLDDKIELNCKMNQTLEAIAQALFKSWFLDPTIAETELPSGWEEKQIGDLVRIVGGGTPSTKESAFWEGGGVHWATPKDMSSLTSMALLGTERQITDLGVRQISSGILPTGTVLLSSRAPIGYLALAEVATAINQGFIAMPPSEVLPNQFLLYWTKNNMEIIKNRANGTTFMEISKSNFRTIPCAVPTRDLLDAFQSKAQTLHQKIVNNLRQSAVLGQLRDCLLPKLISGELRVADAEKHLEIV